MSIERRMVTEIGTGTGTGTDIDTTIAEIAITGLGNMTETIVGIGMIGIGAVRGDAQCEIEGLKCRA